MSEFSTELNNPLDSNHGQMDLPNATGVLVLGICSIVFAFCYGIIGLVCGIIALVLASKSLKEYNLEPSRYKMSSYKNLNAGKICAIIGTCIAGLIFLIFVLYFVIVGTVISGVMSGGFG